MSSTDRGRRIMPPPFSARQIIEQAEAIGEEAIWCLSRPPLNLPPELFHLSFDAAYNEFIYPKYDITLTEDQDLGIDDAGNKILGSFDPLDNAAFIDVSLSDDPRRTFTCWHEVGGHGLLQGEWLRKELTRLRRVDRLITIVSFRQP
jgi:hypothetical protein